MDQHHSRSAARTCRFLGLLGQSPHCAAPCTLFSRGYGVSRGPLAPATDRVNAHSLHAHPRPASRLQQHCLRPRTPSPRQQCRNCLSMRLTRTPITLHYKPRSTYPSQMTHPQPQPQPLRNLLDETGPAPARTGRQRRPWSPPPDAPSRRPATPTPRKCF